MVAIGVINVDESLSAWLQLAGRLPSVHIAVEIFHDSHHCVNAAVPLPNKFPHIKLDTCLRQFHQAEHVVPVKYKFIKTTFIKKKFSSKSTFIKNHFHQKPISSKNPLSSKTNFIKNQFHQRPISSETTFIKNHFHQKPISSKTNFIRALPVRGTHHPSKNNIVSVCVKASRGPKARDTFTQTRLMPTFGVSAEKPTEGPKVGV